MNRTAAPLACLIALLAASPAWSQQVKRPGNAPPTLEERCHPNTGFFDIVVEKPPLPTPEAIAFEAKAGIWWGARMGELPGGVQVVRVEVYAPDDPERKRPPILIFDSWPLDVEKGKYREHRVPIYLAMPGPGTYPVRIGTVGVTPPSRGRNALGPPEPVRHSFTTYTFKIE